MGRQPRRPAVSLDHRETHRKTRQFAVLGFAMPGYESTLQVMGLDLAGVMVSAGPACSSGKLTPSATVAAMGREDLAANAIRVSGGWATTASDWKTCGDVWLGSYEKHQARRQVA